jgi:very-short-patch-repair endonuclease
VENMNEIEKRFQESFRKICTAGYLAQSSYIKTRVEIKVLEEVKEEDEITYKENEGDLYYNSRITTYLDSEITHQKEDVIMFTCQHRVNDGYIVDFLLTTCFPEIVIAIEIDGHDWHEKTKEQAQKDKERGRYLLRNGYHVIRFTGSEVYTKPDDCAKEALDTLAVLYQTLLSMTPESYYAYIGIEVQNG